MKGFIQRLALLIHWIGFALFVSGVLSAVLGLMILIVQGLLVAEVTLIIAAVGIGYGLFLWVLKWLISGNKSFFPWRG
jgi:hypothetical protein